MIRKVDRDSLDLISATALGSMHDPGAALRALSTIAEQTQRLRSSLLAPATPQRLYDVPFPTPVTVAGGVVTRPPDTQVQWPRAGRIFGLRVTLKEGPALLSHVSMGISDEDGLPFFLSTGGGEAFVSLANLQPVRSDYYPFADKVVDAGKSWYVKVTSTDTAGNATYTPQLEFLVDEVK